jgi:hypothetical protein
VKIISISILEENLDIIEKYCNSRGLNRSLFFVKSALNNIGGNYENWKNQSGSGDPLERKSNGNGNRFGKKGKIVSKENKTGNKKRNSGSTVASKIAGKPRTSKKNSGSPGKGEI